MRACVCGYCLLGGNGRLQLFKVMFVEMFVYVLFCRELFVQRSEFNSG